MQLAAIYITIVDGYFFHAVIEACIEESGDTGTNGGGAASSATTEGSTRSLTRIITHLKSLANYIENNYRCVCVCVCTMNDERRTENGERHTALTPASEPDACVSFYCCTEHVNVRCVSGARYQSVLMAPRLCILMAEPQAHRLIPALIVANHAFVIPPTWFVQIFFCFYCYCMRTSARLSCAYIILCIRRETARWLKTHFIV